MPKAHRVWISVYLANDPDSVQRRLEQAVAHFCGACGIPTPPAEKLVIGRTDRGKPFFLHAPQLHLSISHSGKYWGCAIADQTVGFDLQQKEQPRQESPEEMLWRHQRMANRFFHTLEAEFVARDCAHNFLTVWTAREAYVKHTGQGIDDSFSEHCVVPEDNEDRLRISGDADGVQWSAMGKYFQKIPFDREYALCVCTDTPCECTIMEFCGRRVRVEHNGDCSSIA